MESESNLGTKLRCGVFCFPTECGAESSGAVRSLEVGQLWFIMHRAVMVMWVGHLS